MSRNPYTADFAFQIELILVQLEQMNKRLDMLERTFTLMDSIRSQTPNQTTHSSSIETKEVASPPQQFTTNDKPRSSVLRRGSIA